jgi:hypothetical protein
VFYCHFKKNFIFGKAEVSESVWLWSVPSHFVSPQNVPLCAGAGCPRWVREEERKRRAEAFDKTKCPSFPLCFEVREAGAKHDPSPFLTLGGHSAVRRVLLCPLPAFQSSFSL